jgi:hypothetical protein
MSSSNSVDSSVKTKIEWGPLRGFWGWLMHTRTGGLFGYSFLIAAITLLGWFIPVYTVTHAELSPPKYLYEGDIFTLSNNILGSPSDSVTMTLVSSQPFTMSLDMGSGTKEVQAELTFDQHYWIKNQRISNLGFKIEKAQARVEKYQYISNGNVPYTLVSTHGYPIINNTLWLMASVTLRFIGSLFIFLYIVLWEN